MAGIRARGRVGSGVRADRPRLALLFVAILAATGFLALSPGGRRMVGLSPRSVLFVYVREENSLGLTALPSPDRLGRSCLDASHRTVTLPEDVDRVPPGTLAFILRETYTAGVLTGAEVTFLPSFPGLVSANATGPSEASADSSYTLLAVDILVDRAGPSGRDRDALRFEVVGGSPAGSGVLTTVLRSGEEWWLGAVTEAAGVAVLGASDPGREERLKAAFYEDRPVSVISITNFGRWSTDRIEPDSGG